MHEHKLAGVIEEKKKLGRAFISHAELHGYVVILTRRPSLPFDGGVVLVDEVGGQGKKLLFGSNLVWLADVLVGHHHRANAHIFTADRHLKTKQRFGRSGMLFVCLLLLFSSAFVRSNMQHHSQLMTTFGANSTQNMPPIRTSKDKTAPLKDFDHGT